MTKLETEFNKVIMGLEDIGRCVYYAKSFNPSKDVDVQLDRILQILGINEPKNVGLSNSILTRNKKQ